jgi:hypothetical protein
MSRYPFSPQHKRELTSLLASPDYSPFWNRLAEFDLADHILARLRPEAKNDARAADLKPISLERVADFLAALSSSEKADLAKIVKSGLRDLGIPYRKRGRRRAETLYFDYVNALERAIEHTGVFARKSQIREQFGAKWGFEFKRLLALEKWPENCVDWLKRPRMTARALALNIASETFDVSYDRVRRACLNAGKSVKK